MVHFPPVRALGKPTPVRYSLAMQPANNTTKHLAMRAVDPCIDSILNALEQLTPQLAMSRLTIPVDKRDNQTGNPNARITLVEYGDYQCPYCALTHPLVKRLLWEHGGIIRFVFRNFPMQNVHHEAMRAALTAYAASRQNRFWEMHDLLFGNQARFDKSFFPILARELNLNMLQFVADFHSEAALSKVNGDFESGLHSGVNGTPSFFVNDEKITLSELSYDMLFNAVIRQMNVLV